MKPFLNSLHMYQTLTDVTNNVIKLLFEEFLLQIDCVVSPVIVTEVLE